VKRIYGTMLVDAPLVAVCSFRTLSPWDVLGVTAADGRFAVDVADTIDRGVRQHILAELSPDRG